MIFKKYYSKYLEHHKNIFVFSVNKEDSENFRTFLKKWAISDSRVDEEIFYYDHLLFLLIEWKVPDFPLEKDILLFKDWLRIERYAPSTIKRNSDKFRYFVEKFNRPPLLDFILTSKDFQSWGNENLKQFFIKFIELYTRKRQDDLSYIAYGSIEFTNFEMENELSSYTSKKILRMLGFFLSSYTMKYESPTIRESWEIG